MTGSLWRDSNVRRLAAFAVLGFTSFFLTLSSLPVWADQGGASQGAAGTVTTAMLVVTVVTQFGVPALTRRVGLAAALAAGVVLLAAPTPLFLVSQDLPWLAAVAAVRGAGFAILTVLLAVVAATVAGEERRGESIGIYGLAVAVPSLAAVPAGAALVLSGHFPVVAWAGAVPLAALVLVPGLARGVHLPNTPDRTEAARARRAALAPTVVLLVAALSAGGVLTFLPIDRSDTVVVTVALLAFGVTSAASRWAIGLVVDRRGTGRWLALSLAAGTAGMLVLALAIESGEGASGAALLIAGAAVFGTGHGALQNLTLLAALDRAGTGSAPAVSSVWNAGFDLGTASGALLVGAAASAGLGLSGAFVVCAAAVAATAALGR